MQFKVQRQLTLFITAIFFLNGCNSARAPQEEHFNFSGSIIGGIEVQDADPISAYTVGLFDEKTKSKCTGSLISKDTVLTAAHCVNPMSKDLYILFAKNLYEFGQLNKSKMVLASSFERHIHYSPSRSEGTETYDLALIHFNGGLPAGFQTVDLSSNIQIFPQPGAHLVAAGFGVSNGLWGTGSGILRKVSLRFLQMHSASEFQTEQGAHGVCSGDSGGPLFQNQLGQWIQVGVASRVATKFLGCRKYAVYTRTDVFADWIAQTAEKLRLK